jgi:hypothetical protein
MGKVVTGKGMDDFVQNGTVETIKSERRPKRPQAAAPLEVVPNAPVLELTKTDDKLSIDPSKVDNEESGLEPGDEDLAERAQARINKKHREMKQAQALADKLRAEVGENESFAKNQFDRARLAEEKLSSLERELNELRSKATVAETPKGAQRPDAKDAKFYDDKGQFKAFEYAEELAGYSATKAVEEDRKRQTEERTKAEQALVVKAFEARLEKAREKYPDFKEVVGKSEANVPPYIQQYMVESDFGGDLGYFFAKNPDVFDAISKLSPIKAIAAIGKLEVQWEKAAEPKAAAASPPAKSGAPAPIVPLQSSASAQTNTDPAKMDFMQLRAFRREEARNKQRR